MKKILVSILPAVLLSLMIVLPCIALEETGGVYESAYITSSLVDNAISYDDSFYGADTALQQEIGGDIGIDDFDNDSDTVFLPDSNGILADTGDNDVFKPSLHSDRYLDLDSGATSTTVSEDVHALREYLEFFLFGFVPITIAVILLALGFNWFYKTFISSTFF